MQAYNLNFRYKQFIWGVNDGDVFGIPIQNQRLEDILKSTGIHAGWQTDRFRLIVTNNFNRDKSSDGFGYTGHLSLRYIFSSKSQTPGRGW